MKKILYIILLSTLLLSGCGNKESVSLNRSEAIKVKANELVEIKQKVFVTQCEEIYSNISLYNGKTIKLEGMYDEHIQETTNKTFTYVMRRSPGCCGDDGYTGFQFKYKGELPKQDDWIEVIGDLALEEDDGASYIVLKAKSVKVLATRGKEFVSQ